MENKMNNHEKFLRIFFELLDERELNRGEFAEKCGISKGTVLGWTNKGRLPDYHSLLKIADFFEVTLDYLMGRTSDDVNLQSEHKPKLRVDTYGLEKDDVKLLQTVADRLKKD